MSLLPIIAPISEGEIWKNCRGRSRMVWCEKKKKQWGWLPWWLYYSFHFLPKCASPTKLEHRCFVSTSWHSVCPVRHPCYRQSCAAPADTEGITWTSEIETYQRSGILEWISCKFLCSSGKGFCCKLLSLGRETKKCRPRGLLLCVWFVKCWEVSWWLQIAWLLREGIKMRENEHIKVFLLKQLTFKNTSLLFSHSQKSDVGNG